MLPVIFFCQIFKRRFPNLLSTVTEREGKHEQETDNNDSNSRNGWIRLRPSGAWQASCRSSSSWWTASLSSCTASSPPSSLRMGNCRSCNRNCGNRSRYRGTTTSSSRSGNYRSCAGSSGCSSGSGYRSAASTTSSGYPRNNSIQVVTTDYSSRYFNKSAGFLVRGNHTR